MVFVDDGTKYLDELTTREIEFVEDTVDTYDGGFEASTDKGPVFKSQNDRKASDFIKRVSSHKSGKLFADYTD